MVRLQADMFKPHSAFTGKSGKLYFGGINGYHSFEITFGFASLDFNSRVNKIYAYKLKGFDTEWKVVGGKNSANYTNLNPGEYLFKVKSQKGSRTCQ